MAEFLLSISPLKDKVGPVLIQLPPSYSQDNYSTFAEFLENLPTSHRYAVEFRHPSWYIQNEKTKQLLVDHRVCWVSIDYPDLPRQIYPTTDFLYIRWIGVNNLYHIHTHERLDKTPELSTWIVDINRYNDTVSAIFGFFNNDYAGFAAGTCKRFMRLAGLPLHESGVPHQDKLF